MTTKKYPAQKISAACFKRFGWVIEYPRKSKASKSKNLFRIVVRQPALGWRIAYLVVRDRAIKKLEQHPGSLESFEPVTGRGFLYVCATKDEDKVECFILDRPVILKKGIWHGIVSVSDECDVKITENARVKCVYWPLKAVLGSSR